MRRVPAKPPSFKQNYGVELAQIYHRNAIAITLVARILPQLTRHRHENYRCFQTPNNGFDDKCGEALLSLTVTVKNSAVLAVGAHYNINF